jgi:hypothetical protein
MQNIRGSELPEKEVAVFESPLILLMSVLGLLDTELDQLKDEATP